MQLSKLFSPFFYYNLILILVFSLSVNQQTSYILINFFFYSLFHYLIIYLSFYYYSKWLYLIFFIYGVLMYILLIDQIGPHLVVFFIILTFLNYIKKYLYGLNSKMIYFFLILIQLMVFILEIFLNKFLFLIHFDLFNFFQLSLITLIISFPVFYIFSKIDSQK